MYKDQKIQSVEWLMTWPTESHLYGLRPNFINSILLGALIDVN